MGRSAEYAVGGSGSDLVNAINLFALGARTSTQMSDIYQKGQPHTVPEHQSLMCTNNGTRRITTAVPWQTRAAVPNVIHKIIGFEKATEPEETIIVVNTNHKPKHLDVPRNARGDWDIQTLGLGFR